MGILLLKNNFDYFDGLRITQHIPHTSYLVLGYKQTSTISTCHSSRIKNMGILHLKKNFDYFDGFGITQHISDTS